MIITCEACNTSFNLDDKVLKPTGSKVRCSVCANVFTAFPQPAPAPEPPIESGATEATPEEDSGIDSDMATISAMTAAEPDAPETADPADALTPASDVREKGADGSFDEDTSHDVALDDEPADIDSSTEIENAVSEVLDEPVTDEADTADESGATVIADLDDLDLDSGLSPEIAEEDAAATVIASLDDDDLDLSSDKPSDVAETIIADLDEDDLDLDVPLEAEGEAATIITNLDDDNSEADSDFSLSSDDATAVAIPNSVDDLNDLDLTLDVDPDEDASQNATAAAEGIAEASGLDDDLDLSSLEDLLKDDDDGEDDSSTLATEDDEDPELSLDAVDDVSADDATFAVEESLEDLEFDLDREGDAESTDTGDSDDADQEVDLSEIEKMLEEPESADAKFSSVPDQDLDLDIEASLETEKWMSDSGDDDQLVADEELDLSELEEVLDDVDTDTAEESPVDQELELDLGEEEALGAPTETVAVDSDLDFDLADYEDAGPSKSDTGADDREVADMELEFEVEENRQAEVTSEDEGLEETVAIPESKPDVDTAEAPMPETEPAAPSTPVKPVKKGMSKSLVFLLIIAILGGGGYGTFYLLQQNGIDIPFISDYLKPKVQDPGNLKLTTYDINSKFVDNANVGKLFVITGKVKNGYEQNRGMITLSGKIFSTGKVPVNQERVYCGNIMSDLELANLEWDKIKARLSNRLGDNRSNVKVEPGESIPFMVVFSGLPEDLEEFTIEVTGSTSLK